MQAIALLLSDDPQNIQQYFFITVIAAIASAARLSSSDAQVTIKNILKGFLMSVFAGIVARFACNEWIDSRNIAMLIISICAYTAPKFLNALDQFVDKAGSSIIKSAVDKLKDK